MQHGVSVMCSSAQTEHPINLTFLYVIDFYAELAF